MRASVPVLICGGGPVGLALAAELGWRGVSCLLIEQGDGQITTPKMNEVNTRTMEFCRRWGIDDAVRNCPFPADYPQDVAFVTNLSGYELGRIRRPPRNAQTPQPHSPMQLQVCSQIWFDPILRGFASSLQGVSLRYRHHLNSFEQFPDRVVARISDLDSGKEETIEADYLVGCDGANSMIRRSLEIPLVGESTIGTAISLFFRTPELLRRCGRELGTFFFCVDEGRLWGSLRLIDPKNALWRIMVDNVDGNVTAETVDRDAYLSRALGQSCDVEWVDVSIWRRRSVVAERYSAGRVFLAGDAVHQHSPTGALGMNSGVADAVDLGWKLAAMCDHWGGDRLLLSYDLERRPVGERNVHKATEFFLNNSALSGASGDLSHDTAAGREARQRLGAILMRDIAREFNTIGLQIGYCYENSPICVAEGLPPLVDDPTSYKPSSRPGSRAPHFWLRDGRSTLDLFGRGFVLLRFTGAPEPDQLEAAAKARRVPMTVANIDEPAAAYLYQNRFVLVRPDGHVAWRGDAVPPDADALFNKVRGAA